MLAGHYHYDTTEEVEHEGRYFRWNSLDRWDPLEYCGNLWKSIAMYGNLAKAAEGRGVETNGDVWNSLEIFGRFGKSIWKSMESD